MSHDMKAAIVTDRGVAIATIGVPRPKGAELLVKTRASSLNRADLALAEGGSHGAHGGAGTVLGLEWSGDVVEVGPEAVGYKVGDKVMCSGMGGFAEYALADDRRVFPFPLAPIDYDEAACLTIALRTAFVALVELGRLTAGQSVLTLGASSGVGLMTLQMAKLLGAGLVIGTSTKADRRRRLDAFGADVVIDSNADDWAERVVRHTGGRGVDLVIDFLAGPLVNHSMRAAKLGGRIVNVGRMAGQTGPFDFELHSLRRIEYIGQTFRTRGIEEIGEISQRARTALWPALEAGKLRLPIDFRFPLERIEDAFALMRSNAHFGKIVPRIRGLK